MENPIFHCFFEQSGTFKNQFKKLGYESYDYDILNQFGETDYVTDLFGEINKAYEGGDSIFDKIKSNDQIIAFFPCVRFENQIILYFKGNASTQKKWSIKEKLQYDLKLIDELHSLYSLITKLVLICIEKNLKLIIENPYSTQHFLYRYWSLEPKLIDKDRRDMGDFFSKPTQYWFVNCDPKYNFIFEGVDKKIRKFVKNENQVNRSMIHQDYANKFIREFILNGKEE